MARIRDEARAAGVRLFGVTDHISCRLNRDYLLASRREYDELGLPDGFLFGLEASCLREWDLERNDGLGEEGDPFAYQPGGPEGAELTLYLPDELMAKLKPAYVIGGVHWPLGTPIDRDAVIGEYHRQYMFLATHPQVDVVAHPWWFVTPFWWAGAWRDEEGNYGGPPWFGDFGVVPDSLHDELGAAAVEHGTAIEINAGAIFCNPRYPETFKRQYWGYLAGMKERGVRFALGSDSHCAAYCPERLASIEGDLDRIGITKDDLWMPEPVTDGTCGGR